VAIIIAQLTKAPVEATASFALVYLASRFAHYIFYVTNIDLLRSQTFFVGVGALSAIFILALLPRGAALLEAIYAPAAAALLPLAALLPKF
jgi:hypothetical protein